MSSVPALLMSSLSQGDQPEAIMPPAEKPAKTQICDLCNEKATTVTICPEIREWDKAAEICCLTRQVFTKGKST